MGRTGRLFHLKIRNQFRPKKPGARSVNCGNNRLCVCPGAGSRPPDRQDPALSQAWSLITQPGMCFDTLTALSVWGEKNKNVEVHTYDCDSWMSGHNNESKCIDSTEIGDDLTILKALKVHLLVKVSLLWRILVTTL